MEKSNFKIVLLVWKKTNFPCVFCSYIFKHHSAVEPHHSAVEPDNDISIHILLYIEPIYIDVVFPAQNIQASVMLPVCPNLK